MRWNWPNRFRDSEKGSKTLKAYKSAWPIEISSSPWTKIHPEPIHFSKGQLSHNFPQELSYSLFVLEYFTIGWFDTRMRFTRLQFQLTPTLTNNQHAWTCKTETKNCILDFLINPKKCSHLKKYPEWKMRVKIMNTRSAFFIRWLTVALGRKSPSCKRRD